MIPRFADLQPVMLFMSSNSHRVCFLHLHLQPVLSSHPVLLPVFRCCCASELVFTL